MVDIVNMRVTPKLLDDAPYLVVQWVNVGAVLRNI